jgi:hypothetical protein
MTEHEEVTEVNAEVYDALADMMRALRLRGESGTEILLQIIYDAARSVKERWSEVEAYKAEHGRFRDVNAMLAAAIETERRRWGVS